VHPRQKTEKGKLDVTKKMINKKRRTRSSTFLDEELHETRRIPFKTSTEKERKLKDKNRQDDCSKRKKQNPYKKTIKKR
jgi:hypothetical protein